APGAAELSLPYRARARPALAVQRVVGGLRLLRRRAGLSRVATRQPNGNCRPDRHWRGRRWRSRRRQTSASSDIDHADRGASPGRCHQYAAARGDHDPVAQYRAGPLALDRAVSALSPELRAPVRLVDAVAAPRPPVSRRGRALAHRPRRDDDPRVDSDAPSAADAGLLRNLS